MTAEQLKALNDELAEKWLRECRHDWQERPGFLMRWKCPKCGMYSNSSTKDSLPAVGMEHDLVGTWDGFGCLMEEAERRGYCDVRFITGTGTLGVMARLYHKDGVRVDGPLGKDKRTAFALACAKAAGIEVNV